VPARAGAVGRYEEHLLQGLPNRLDGLRIVVDCADGAASPIAPAVYDRAGATVIAIHATPNGENINEGCGSTHLGDLIEAVRAHGADAGIAHDGDADRCLAIDAQGNVIDGDHILAILATSMREAGRLPGDTVVATVMANLGFRIAMRDAGISVVETAVGDRYVLEAMKAGGHALGGEQSGHVVLLDHATTGDGLLTALHLLGRVRASGRTLAELAQAVTKLPQVLLNVTEVDRAALAGCDEVAQAVASAQAELGDTGRILLRPSGTEPVIRVMVEGDNADEVEAAVASICAAVEQAAA